MIGLGSPVLVVGVSSAAATAFKPDFKTGIVKKRKKGSVKKMSPCLVQSVRTEVKRFFFLKRN